MCLNFPQRYEYRKYVENSIQQLYDYDITAYDTCRLLCPLVSIVNIVYQCSLYAVYHAYTRNIALSATGGSKTQLPEPRLRQLDVNKRIKS
jgi:hypothetical protein